MANDRKQLIPLWPDALADVDIVKVRFALDFLSPCVVQPAVFLGLGRTLRVTGRQLLNAEDPCLAQQWAALFQPALSEDPVARRRFQKPAPSFVMTMPLSDQRSLDAGDRLELEVLFVGTGIPSIHYFLRCLIHLGHLGLVSGEGQYEVTEVVAQQPDGTFTRAWRQGDSISSMVCPVQSLLWQVQREQITDQLVASFTTPTRLLVNGKPLRKPRFSQIFPFMLRRVTSMIHAHCNIEVADNFPLLIEKARQIEILHTSLVWADWRNLTSQQGVSIGGFMGAITVQGDVLEDIFWVLSVSHFLGIGKGAPYGAGHFSIKES